jgi:hypothetical protein
MRANPPTKPRGSLVFYYGYGETRALSRYKRAVLQAAHYRKDELGFLQEHQVECYAYLSLGEDAQATLAWHRGAVNSDWNTAYVRLNDAWQAQVLCQGEEAFEQGFAGLFLDTLDMVDLFPEEREAMLELIRKLRKLAADRPLLANRGFSLMPELGRLVDGVVFEAFSSRWTADGSYQALTATELAWTEQKALELQQQGIRVFALDYADTPELCAFAKQRAERFGFGSSLGNRYLTQLDLA